MKIYTFFNKQRTNKDGMIPIYVCIARQKRLYIHTGLFTSKVFDCDIFPKSERNAKAKTIRLNEISEQIEKIALENSLLSDRELKILIQDKVFNKRAFNTSLSDMIRKYAETCKSKNTKDTYISCAIRVDAYDSSAPLNVSNIWIDGFREYLESCNLKVNSIGLYLTKIKAVLNWAHDNGLNVGDVKFSIPSSQTRNRNLPVAELRNIISASHYEGTMAVCRDIFVLMFYLIGINIRDLMKAKHDDVIDGRLEYDRLKTGKHYSIKIEPEAMAIIRKYEGKEYLLKFSEESKISSFITLVNENLKHVRKDLSTYYSRHSWATIASDLEIPIETISNALGHSHGARVTNIYINFDRKKIDEANRKVIDYVLNLR